MSTRWIVAAVAVAAVALAVYVLRPGEERRVRTRLEALAAALGTPANEPDLARLARVAGLRKYLADDAIVYFAEDRREPIRGREAIVGVIAGALSQMAGPFSVELDEVRITIRDSASVADVHLEGRLVARDGKAGPSTIDARPVGLTLTKIEGTWLVTGARILHEDDAVR